MKIAYTAGPMREYTLDGITYTWDTNIAIARKAYDAATRAGWYTISPHLLSGHDSNHTLSTPQEYINRDLEFLRMVRPDIIMLPRWTYSSGAQQEFDLAIDLGLDIYHYDEKANGIYFHVSGGTRSVVPNA